MCPLYGGRLWFKCSCRTWRKRPFYGVYALEKFCYKGFLRNSSGTKCFVRPRKVSALEDVRFREIPLYSIEDNFKEVKTILKNFELLKGWFYENHMVLNPGKWHNSRLSLSRTFKGPGDLFEIEKVRDKENFIKWAVFKRFNTI